MTMTATQRRTEPAGVIATADAGPGPQSSSGARRILSRPTLPNSRAVVGGLLVVVAMLGTFAAYARANGGSATRYVVAAHDVAPGTRLGPDDLAFSRIDLSGTIASRSFTDPGVLIGQVTVAPLGAGELVQLSSVVEGGDGGATRISFPLDTNRAVNGALRPGDRIDVLATYGTGETATTEIVVEGALVVGVDAGGDGALGTSGTTVLTVGLANRRDAVRLANAAAAGSVTAVRTTLASN